MPPKPSPNPEPSPNMDSEEFRAAAHQTVDWIADFLRDSREYRVVPETKPGDVTAQLPASAPESGESMDAILSDFRTIIAPNLTHWNHPRFFAYFANTSSGPGILGEMLTAALNVNQMLWKSGPAATELEQTTLGWLRQWLGLPEDFFGIIHDTASTATQHAILAAREYASPATRLTGEFPPLVLYTSQHANSSVDKGALASGVGLANIRHVPCDAEYRMDPAALVRMIHEDLTACKQPFCVVPTVGTTSTASIDPISAIGEIARRYNLWMHVDAAYAGPAAILDEYRWILEGAAQADSLVLNPHKWLFAPMDLSVFYIRHPDLMRRAVALEEIPPYLQSSGQGVNLTEYSMQLGRRFRSLKLWFVLRYYGRSGVEQILREHLRFAADLCREIEKDARFELAAPALFSLVCFRYRGSDETNRDILERINTSGFSFLSSTLLHGKVVLRLAIGNANTTWEDVLETWERIRALAPAA